ncbi:MAG: DUF1638 domain-containing protein [Bryobacteraceae bacterium]
MRLKLISCDVLYRETCAAVSRSVNQVDVEFLRKGLHDLVACDMCQQLQEAVDRVDPETYDAVLMGYGLCGTGLVGLTAHKLRIVVPRAHDCITLFLGDKERYLHYFQENPGVYFTTTGWIERGERLGDLNQPGMQVRGIEMSHEELVAKYGEENAAFLEEELGAYKKQYRQYTFIQMGLEPDDRFERHTQERATERGWKFEKVLGDMTLIETLVNGPWDDKRFLVVEPGWRVVARYDESIISAEKAS